MTSVALAPSGPSGFATCALAPMSLELRSPEGRAHTLLRLESDGRVHVQGFGTSLDARIDAQGCLHGPDGLWAELTPSGSVWTPHALMRADASSLWMPDGVRHEFGSDGRVTRVEANGERATGEYGSVWIPGYRPDAHCSAVLLYTAMLSMMPSMAVVDGVARREPPPPDARCAKPAKLALDLAIPKKLPTLRTQGMGCGGVGSPSGDDCVLRLPLDRELVHPGAPPAPARLHQLDLAAGVAAKIARDDALTTIAVVLEGSVLARAEDGAESRGHTEERGRPLERVSLERGAGFRAVGGGVVLHAERHTKLLVAQVLRRERATFVEHGKPWAKRPGPASDGFVRFDLSSVARLRWAEGRFAAAIAQEGELVDASLTLLGIAGGASVPEHSHDDAWELLVILQGAGTMTLGSGDAQRTIEVRPGSTLRIPRAVPHAFVASPGDAVIAVQLYTPPGAEQRFKKLAAE